MALKRRCAYACSKCKWQKNNRLKETAISKSGLVKEARRILFNECVLLIIGSSLLLVNSSELACQGKRM